MKCKDEKERRKKKKKEQPFHTSVFWGVLFCFEMERCFANHFYVLLQTCTYANNANIRKNE